MFEARDLKTECLPARRGIVAPTPEFAWAFCGDRNGQRQTGSEISLGTHQQQGKTA